MRKILIFALMSVMVGAVNARTAKQKLTEADSIVVEHFLKYTELNEDDKLLVQSLVRHQNGPLEGNIVENGAIHRKAKYGDAWKAYISFRKKGFYLTYEVKKPNGRRVGKVYRKI